MNLIAIVDKNWGIAKNGEQIRPIPADLKRFRKLTMGGTVIMGRRTYEAIGHALLGRKNIVISRTMKSGGNFEVWPVLLDLWPFMGNLWAIGGESIYRQLLPYCNKAYITYVDADLGADQFCPNLDNEDGWVSEMIGETKWYNGLTYWFVEYRRA